MAVPSGCATTFVTLRRKPWRSRSSHDIPPGPEVRGVDMHKPLDAETVKQVHDA